jgi:hypothetical protein
MIFDEHQSRLWKNMIESIKKFRVGDMLYSDLVGELQGALDSGDYQDKELVLKWYNLWSPLEILNAKYGNGVLIEDAEKCLFEMQVFLEYHMR